MLLVYYGIYIFYSLFSFFYPLATFFLTLTVTSDTLALAGGFNASKNTIKLYKQKIGFCYGRMVMQPTLQDKPNETPPPAPGGVYCVPYFILAEVMLLRPKA